MYAFVYIYRNKRGNNIFIKKTEMQIYTRLTRWAPIMEEDSTNRGESRLKFLIVSEVGEAQITF